MAFREVCYRLNIGTPPSPRLLTKNSYIEALTPSVECLEMGPLGRIMVRGGHEGTLISTISVLKRLSA